MEYVRLLKLLKRSEIISIITVGGLTIGGICMSGRLMYTTAFYQTYSRAVVNHQHQLHNRMQKLILFVYYNYKISILERYLYDKKRTGSK